MVNSRINNSKRNIISGLFKQCFSLVLAFVTRSLVLYKLGAEYQGLNGVFSSLLQVLNLTDLGFSSAVTFILYEPIAENNTQKICAILKLLKKIYTVVGLSIIVLGFCILPFLNQFVRSEVPKDINIYLLFLIFLVSNALSYFMAAYKSTLLSSTQREDVINNISTLTSFAIRLIQIIILLMFGNYTAYIAMIVLETVINNIMIGLASRRLFPQLSPKGETSVALKKELFKQVKGVFIGKMGDVARNSFDNIILSFYLGLVAVAVYGNYYYIFTSIYGIMGIIIHGMSASIGNSIAIDTVDKNYKDMQLFNYIFMNFVGWCSVCMFCLYQPFMNLWMNHNAMLVLPDKDMLLFCVYFYAINMTYVRSMYLDGCGLFYECRFWCVTEAIANLLLNIILGKFFGVTGILIATIFTIFAFNFIGRTNILFKYYFKNGLFKFYLEHFVYFQFAVGIALTTKFVLDYIDSKINGIFYVRFVLCIIISLLLYIIVNINHPLFKRAKSLLNLIVLTR